MAGLYSGITFSSGTSSVEQASKDAGATTTASKVNAGQPGPVLDDKQITALEDAAKYAAASAEQAAAAAAEGARKAALTFQPIVRKRPAPGANKPKNVLSATAHISAGPSLSSTVAKAEPLGSASPANVKADNASRGPMSASPAVVASTSNAPILTGRTLVVPPSMTLDEEDVNGFKASAAGKKAANKNKKRKGRSKREEDPALAWTAEYDPARPTDYNEYKIYAKFARAERREAARREREAEKRRQARQAYGESGSGSDYTGSDEDDDDGSDAERRRRIAAAEKRFVGFAPPKVYDMPPEEAEALSAQPEIIDVDMEPNSAVVDNDPIVVTEAPADEWAAWSAAQPEAEAAVVDDPYARRMALSQQQSRTQEASVPQAAPVRTVPPNPQTPSPYPSSFSSGQSSIPGIPDNIPMPPPVWYAQHTAPTSTAVASVTGGASPVPVIPVQPQPVAGPSGSVSIEEAQAKARAIAARLAALGKLGSAPTTASPYQMPSADEPIPGLSMPNEAEVKSTRGNAASSADPKTFAKDLMAKYGWSKGQGLGATAQGMLNPLALSAETTKGGKGKKKDDVVVAKVTGMANAKGRVISDLKTEKEKAEKEKYGEPTRIVCLTNMVGREDAGDEELVADVSEEARKHGILEHCFVHQMPIYVPEDEAVRVFITFSGLVGAWKAVKAFDGRFFGGRTVKAKFYDETAFATRTLHL